MPAPYRSSDEHLREELARIDQLVRAETVRWQALLAQHKPPGLWGMVHVTHEEVEAYLHAPPAAPGEVPAALEDETQAHRQRAAELLDTIEGRRQSTPGSVPLRLELLGRRFGLSRLERDVLLVGLLPQLDDRYRRLFGYLQDDASRTLPTVELTFKVLRPHPGIPAGWPSLAADRPLRAFRLLAPPGDGPEAALAMHPVRVEDRVAAYLLGGDAPDARLDPVLTPQPKATWDDLVTDEAQLERLKALADWWQARRQAGLGASLFLHGPYGSGRLAAARAIGTATGTPVLRLDVDAALHRPEGWEEIVALAYREAALADAALYWADTQTLLGEGHELQLEVLLDHAAPAATLTFLGSDRPWDPAGRFRDTPFLRLDFPAPGYELRTRTWRRRLLETGFALPEADQHAQRLARDFQLTGGQIDDALATARWHATQRDPDQPRPTLDDLYEGCRRQSGRRLISLARRIEPPTGLSFDDVVLPPANRRQLDELRTRIRHRSLVYSQLGFEQRTTFGQGLIALFTGSSGTGKTMSATLLAQEQGVDLYKVDLAAVVSKWVGETEKNLSRLFDEAEDANALLFFDEADALFGKRGEVKEAQDRWANLETNYLLQRVESYRGVVVLASNLRQNLDPAFLRRIHAIVEYPFPDAAARLEIWTRSFPANLQSPSRDDLRQLADRFQLAGGSIMNIIVDATFRALAADAAAPVAVTLRHLVASTAREYQKLGRPTTKADFGEELYTWVETDILLMADGERP